MQQRSLQRREYDFDNQTGPDWDNYLALQKRVQSGDTSAARQMQGVKPNPQSVMLPHLPWETQKAGNDRLDVAAEHAGDFDYCGWTAVVDVMPMLVSALAINPNATSQQISAWGHPNGFSAAEIAAVKAHRIELAQLLGVRYKTDAMIAAQNAPPPATAMPAGCGRRVRHQLHDVRRVLPEGIEGGAGLCRGAQGRHGSRTEGGRHGEADAIRADDVAAAESRRWRSARRRAK